MLWNRSLVIQDVETKSLWSHLLGKAMDGKLKGKTLKPIVSDMTTWSDWKTQHPKTTVLNMSRTAERYTRGMFLRPEMYVAGFEANGKVYSIPFKRLAEEKVISIDVQGQPLLATWDENGTVARLYSRKIDDTTFTFFQDGERLVDDETKSEWNPSTGAAVSGPSKDKSLKQHVIIVSYDKAWQTFHPESVTLSEE